MKEVYRDIKGYEGIYQVSNLGCVIKINIGKRRESYKMSLVDNGQGYLVVGLRRDKIKKMHRVSRLVSLEFVKNPFNKKEVNHIDEVKTNNVSTNLEWVTRKENQNHGTRNNRCSLKQGKKVYQLKDGVLIKEWQSQGEAKRCGYSQGLISNCCNGKRKSHKGYQWSFKRPIIRKIDGGEV
jgi:hypothetical protein